MDDDIEIILAININPTFEEFLGFLSIKMGSLGSQLFEPVYKQIFIFSKDLKSEYVKYYSVEYPTLSEYIEIYHDRVLDEEQLDKRHIYKFKNGCELTSNGYDTNYLDRIINILEDHDEN